MPGGYRPDEHVSRNIIDHDQLSETLDEPDKQSCGAIQRRA